MAATPLFSDHGTSCRVEAKEKGSERGGLSGVGMRRAALGGGLVSIGGNGSDGADDGPASEAEADVASTPLATSPMTLSLVGEIPHREAVEDLRARRVLRLALRAQTQPGPRQLRAEVAQPEGGRAEQDHQQAGGRGE